MKAIFKLIVLIIAFMVASGATYVAFHKWKAVEAVNSAPHRQDTIDGVNGLSEGEVVSLPTLTTLSQDEVNLGDLKEERLLCVFIGSRCSGCTMDAELWKDLKEESAKRGVAFYLIDIGDELPDLQRFSAAYNLQNFPILFDPNNKVGRRLKVGFLPQYVLFSRTGEVLHRWDGVRRYSRQAGAQQLAQFFQPHD